MNRIEFRAYRCSPEWGRKRLRRIRKDKYTCQTCGQFPPLYVHHRTYARVGRERLSDLISLCPPCHAAITHSIKIRGVDQHWPSTIWSWWQRLAARLRL